MNGRGGVVIFFLFLFLFVIILLQIFLMVQSDRFYDGLNRFNEAFESGADFICVGMFDFQVKQDAELAAKAIAESKNRARPWA